jgi:hypothetical protein
MECTDLNQVLTVIGILIAILYGEITRRQGKNSK